MLPTKQLASTNGKHQQEQHEPFDMVQIITETVIAKLELKYVMVPKTLDFTSYEDRAHGFKTICDLVIIEVCNYFGIQPSSLKNRERVRKNNLNWRIPEIRFMAFSLCREFTDKKIAFAKIGESFDNRSHCDVRYGCIQCKDRCDIDKEFKNDYNQIKSNINKTLKPTT